MNSAQRYVGGIRSTNVLHGAKCFTGAPMYVKYSMFYMQWDAQDKSSTQKGMDISERETMTHVKN